MFCRYFPFRVCSFFYWVFFSLFFLLSPYFFLALFVTCSERKIHTAIVGIFCCCWLLLLTFKVCGFWDSQVCHFCDLQNTFRCHCYCTIYEGHLFIVMMVPMLFFHKQKKEWGNRLTGTRIHSYTRSIIFTSFFSPKWILLHLSFFYYTPSGEEKVYHTLDDTVHGLISLKCAAFSLKDK
jgi:hypothetical protein